MEEDTVHLKPSVVGVYGWRKRCLYFFVLLLVALIMVNLGLTVWILVVLKFNIHGMGELRITDEGLALDGRAEFTDPLYAVDIAAYQDDPVTVMSDRAVRIKAGGSEVKLDGDNVDIVTSGSFQVHSQDQTVEQPLFSLSREGSSVGPRLLEALGPRGAAFRGPVEAVQIQSPLEGGLRLDAPSGKLDMTGTRAVFFSLSLDMTSYGDILFSSSNITLNTRSLSLQSVPVSVPLEQGRLWEGVREVCVCRSGQVYTVEARSDGPYGCHDNGGFCKK